MEDNSPANSSSNGGGITKELFNSSNCLLWIGVVSKLLNNAAFFESSRDFNVYLLP